MFGWGIRRDVLYKVKRHNDDDVGVITNDFGVDIIIRLNVPCNHINGYRWTLIEQEDEDAST